MTITLELTHRQTLAHRQVLKTPVLPEVRTRKHPKNGLKDTITVVWQDAHTEAELMMSREAASDLCQALTWALA